MGLFKSIKKAFKKVFKGIGKVFKKVLAKVGKVLNSKWGKILMLAAAVFTGGMALAGGISAFGASTAPTFAGKFIAGAKGFLTALANPVQQAKSMLGGAEAAAAAGQGTAAAAGAMETGATAAGAGGPAAQVAEAAAGGASAATTGVTQAAGQTAGQTIGQAAQQAGQLITEASPGFVGPPSAAAGSSGGWLSKAAGMAKDFVTSPSGQQMIGQMATGYADAAAAEKLQEREFAHEDRIRQRWMDPNNPLAAASRQPGFGRPDVEFKGGPGAIAPESQMFGPQTTGALPGEPGAVG